MHQKKSNRLKSIEIGGAPGHRISEPTALRWIGFEMQECGAYLMRKLPLRWVWAFRVAGDLVPVPLFSCDNWLALVRGNRGDGLPVPGRTGGVHSTTTLWNAQNQTHTNKPMAIKAFILPDRRTLFWSSKFLISYDFFLPLFFFFCFGFSRRRRRFKWTIYFVRWLAVVFFFSFLLLFCWQNVYYFWSWSTFVAVCLSYARFIVFDFRFVRVSVTLLLKLLWVLHCFCFRFWNVCSVEPSLSHL